MQLGIANGHVVRWSENSAQWVSAGGDVPADVADLLGGVAGRPPQHGGSLAPSGLPFQPSSFRGVMLSESHYIAGARTMIRHFLPSPLRAFIAGYELTTRRTFPALKPPQRFYEAPASYFGNHVSMIADGDTVRFPASSKFWDFELELGAIVTRHWDSHRDGIPTAADVIGAFTVVNDFSARDLQWRDERRGAFGGVVKSKSFATGMASTIVTADEVLPRWDRVVGRAYVNEQLWCEGSTAGGLFSLDDVIAEMATDERLVPGELISLGTLPGCCGLELDRFLAPGDTLRLELDGIGTVSNLVGNRT